MIRKLCKYSDAALIKMGYSVPSDDFYLPRSGDIVKNIYDEYNKWAKGNFANIIDVIYDGTTRNNISKLISENCPPDVRNFIDNFLMKQLPSIPPAPDDETAFSMIIPRDCQSSAELLPYIEEYTKIIENYNNSLNSGSDGIES